MYFYYFFVSNPLCLSSLISFLSDPKWCHPRDEWPLRGRGSEAHSTRPHQIEHSEKWLSLSCQKFQILKIQKALVILEKKSYFKFSLFRESIFDQKRLTNQRRSCDVMTHQMQGRLWTELNLHEIWKRLKELWPWLAYRKFDDSLKNLQ